MFEFYVLNHDWNKKKVVNFNIFQIIFSFRYILTHATSYNKEWQNNPNDIFKYVYFHLNISIN